MDMKAYDLEVSKDWERAQSLLASGATFDATISASNTMGLVVKFGHLHGFIPTARITSRPRPPAGAEDWMPMMSGMKLQLKVIEADKALRRLVFSER
jgi:ribosomal protein S1